MPIEKLELPDPVYYPDSATRALADKLNEVIEEVNKQEEIKFQTNAFYKVMEILTRDK